ncbi:MAG TPA: hypothetical protein VKB03_04130 [Conexibacter sp.]|nr:hypothetical protein [Conexibacter sp.]
MNRKAAITVNRSLDEVQRLWRSSDWSPDHIDDDKATVTFAVAPGDRGTEIHVELASPGPGGKVGEVVETVVGAGPVAKAKDELRHFKQLVETGEIARSDAAPEGERVGRKLKQRPAQPLAEHELEKAGA